MLHFNSPALSDRQKVTEIVANSSYFGCEYYFSTIFIWQKSYCTNLAFYDNFFFARSCGGKLTYSFPCGSGDIGCALELIRQDSKERGLPFRLHGVTPKGLDILERLYPGQFEVQPVRAAFDYVYRASDLAELAGKKYDGKRNHIKKFEKKYDASLVEITSENLDQCIAFAEKWYTANESPDQMFAEEKDALRLAFENYFELNLTGAMLVQDNGTVIAFTLGEGIIKESGEWLFVTHFEKALREYDGSYAKINCDFARMISPRYYYINREEDLGIEGLRKAKLSYHPEFLVEKSVVIFDANA